MREDAPVGPGATLWGVWGTAEDDLWAVGDDGGPGVLLHRSAGGWEDASGELPAGIIEGSTLYKVWGTQGGDVWVAGSRGRLARRVAGVWSAVPMPADVGGTPPLLTVHAAAGGEPFVVGGAGTGVVLAWDGAKLTSQLPEGMGPSVINGVRAGPSALGDVVAVGSGGAVLSRRGGTWTEEIVTPWSLHAVWVDGRGEVWASGGDLSVEHGSGAGVLLHYGDVVPQRLFRGL